MDSACDHPKVILSIAGFDPTGGAGIIADSRTASHFGCYCCTLITSITSQNSTGFYRNKATPISLLESQLDAVLQDFEVAAVKIGLITDMKIASFVSSSLETYFKSTPIVIDPIISTTKSDQLVDSDLLAFFKSTLFPLATVLTPNLKELETISDKALSTRADIRKAVQKLIKTGTDSIVITGYKSINSRRRIQVSDLMFSNDKFSEINRNWIQTNNSHGSGCIFSTSVACNLALGFDTYKSIGIAGDYINSLLINSKTYSFKSATGVTNQYGPLL